MKDLFLAKLAFIPVLIMVVMVLCIITGCDRLEKDLTGGVELIMKIETEEAVIRVAQQSRYRLVSHLKDSGIIFSGTAVKNTGTIEISGLREQDKEKIKDILADGFNRMDYEFPGDNLILKLKQGAAEQLKKQAVTHTLEVINKRLSAYGVREKYVEIESPGSDRLRVRIPPDVDAQRIKSLIRRMGILELLPVVSGPYPSVENALEKYNGTLPDDLKVLKFDSRNREKGYLILKANPVITGQDVEKAIQKKDTFGQPSVYFSLDDVGAGKFRNYTAANIGKKLAVVLDNLVITAPVIQDVLSKDSVVTGQFTIEEAEDLALVLRSGALPAPVTFLKIKGIEKEKR